MCREQWLKEADANFSDEEEIALPHKRRVVNGFAQPTFMKEIILI